MTTVPADYSASEYPASQYAASDYPESHYPPSSVGPSVSQVGSFRSSRRAETAPTHPLVSPPPTIRMVPPSAPASSRGYMSPPASGNSSTLAPIHEGFQTAPPTRNNFRTPSPSAINPYPSPAASHDGQSFEESYTDRTNSKVKNWLSKGSVSANGSVRDEFERLNLNDGDEEMLPPPSHYPLSPPGSNPNTPYSHLPDTNPFKAMAQEDWNRRRKTLS